MQPASGRQTGVLQVHAAASNSTGQGKTAVAIVLDFIDVTHW